MGYEELLSRAMKKVPDKTGSGERFEMPKSKMLKQGVRTIFINFNEVISKLRRDQKHFLKFLLKELATSFEERDGKMIFQGVFTEEQVNRKIESYVKHFVICPKCSRPDTKIVEEGESAFLVCEACGNKQQIKKV
ncbi:MAG: translation initiation factor IF-2 subunit beta [Nanoarchaeota archaeon]